jgi:hypothetical protein
MRGWLDLTNRDYRVVIVAARKIRTADHLSRRRESTYGVSRGKWRGEQLVANRRDQHRLTVLRGSVRPLRNLDMGTSLTYFGRAVAVAV